MSDLPDFVRQKSKTNPNFYEVSVPKGYVLFTEGDDARHLYVVTSGSLEIFDDVTKQRIAVISKGSAFGEQAVLLGGKQKCIRFVQLRLQFAWKSRAQHSEICWLTNPRLCKPC